MGSYDTAADCETARQQLVLVRTENPSIKADAKTTSEVRRFAGMYLNRRSAPQRKLEHMKPRHTAAPALVGRYLMVPPVIPAHDAWL